MLKYLWSHFKKQMRNERGTWAGVGVGISALSVANSIAASAGAYGGGGDEFSMQYQQLPDYPEVDLSRKTWGQKLQDWGALPDYGAISPDWAAIWDLAKQKIDQQYWGGVGTTGLAGKVKASAARRGVSESPALETNLTNLGLQQGQDVANLASQEAINKATFSEQGRQNWLSSLQSLTSLKPSFMTSTGVTPGSSVGNTISTGLTGLAGIAGQLSQQDWLTKLLNSLGKNPGTNPNVNSIYNQVLNTNPQYDYNLGSALKGSGVR